MGRQVMQSPWTTCQVSMTKKLYLPTVLWKTPCCSSYTSVNFLRISRNLHHCSFRCKTWHRRNQWRERWHTKKTGLIFLQEPLALATELIVVLLIMWCFFCFFSYFFPTIWFVCCN